MGKCSACLAGDCKGEYERRWMCKDWDNCTCTCHENASYSFWKGFTSILVGTGAVVGGVALTVATGGLAAVVAGGLVVGAGSSMVINPIAKKISGERMTATDYITDVAVGSVVGVASGGIGAGGSLLSKGASGVVKVGVRIGAGAVAGATSGAISETGRAIKGEEVSLESYGKSMGMGVVCGGVAGASSHLASNVSKLAGSEVGKAATRIGTQAATSAATDVTLQVIENDGDFTKVDVSRVALTATGQAIVATAAEGGRGLAERTNAYNKTVNTALIEEDFPTDKTKKEEIMNRVKEANRISDTEIKAQKDLVEHRNNLKRLDAEKVLLKEEHKALATERKALVDDRRNTGSNQKNTQKLADCQGKIDDIRKKTTSVNSKIESTKAKIHDYSVNNGNQDKIGENKFHLLHSERTGQAAMDIPDQNQNRGAERIILDQDPSKKFVYAGHTGAHDYDIDDRKPAPGQRPRYSPYDALKPEKFLDPIKKIDEDDEWVTDDDEE